MFDQTRFGYYDVTARFISLIDLRCSAGSECGNIDNKIGLLLCHSQIEFRLRLRLRLRMIETEVELRFRSR